MAAMEYTQTFRTLGEMADALSAFRAAGVPDDAEPKITGSRGSGPYRLIIQHDPNKNPTSETVDDT